MRIISAKMTVDGERLPIPPAIIMQDHDRLLEEFAKLCKENPLADMFGGVIRIDNRSYQVC